MANLFLSSRSKDGSLHTLDIRSDDSDARDYIFQPSLSLLPPTVDHRGCAPVLDQLTEGACVGFALATVINVSHFSRLLYLHFNISQNCRGIANRP
jgi:hypothetical protein